MQKKIDNLRDLNLKIEGLVREKNYFYKNRTSMTAELLCWVIKEYSAFSNEAIHMLIDASIRVHDWEKLAEEVMHNIEEERGLETKKVPHLEMMRVGYMKELNIDTDAVVCSDITASFLKRMRKLFKHNDNAFVAGCLLALEGTAVEEFHIVDGIVRAYSDASQLGFKKNWLTNLYIDGHKTFEIGHEQHLLDALTPYVNDDNFENFSLGYRAVCDTMSAWWVQLEEESNLFTLDRLISKVKTVEPDIHKIFEEK